MASITASTSSSLEAALGDRQRMVGMADPAAVEAHQRRLQAERAPHPARGEQPASGGDDHVDAELADLAHRMHMAHGHLAIFGEQGAVEVEGEQAWAHGP